MTFADEINDKIIIDLFPSFVYPKLPSVDTGFQRVSKPDILA
jgi:hypothetical protein